MLCHFEKRKKVNYRWQAVKLIVNNFPFAISYLSFAFTNGKLTMSMGTSYNQ